MTFAMMSVTVSPFKGSVARQHLIQNATKRRSVRRHFDIGRLEISMDDAWGMRGFEGLTDMLRDCGSVFNSHRTTLNALCERLTLDKFENQKLNTVCFLQIVDARDVWVIQRCQDVS